MAQTQKTMNVMGCGKLGCTHDHSKLFMTQKCHPGAGTDALYIKATGVLEIRCHECETPITEILVAVGETIQ